LICVEYRIREEARREEEARIEQARIEEQARRQLEAKEIRKYRRANLITLTIVFGGAILAAVFNDPWW